MFLNKKQQKILLIFLIGAVFLFLFVGKTKAAVGDESIGAAIIHYTIGYLGSLLVKLGAALTNASIQFNFRILDPIYNPFILTGWQICRDLANLGLVLFIIIIAIATILRIESYGAKSTLAKLIAVALLVNFSLTIAGVMIDFSNMLTRNFVNSINTVGVDDFAGALATAFAPQTLLEYNASQSEKSGWLKDWMDGWSIKAFFDWIGSFFFVIIFTFIVALTLLALAAMFLVRFVWLCILLVLAPLACLFWILPATKKLWNLWWSHFMKWLIFAPVASFFLYLGVKMLIEQGDKIQEVAMKAQGGSATAIANGVGSLPTIVNGILMVGFVLGGLIVGEKMGVMGSDMFMGWARRSGNWAKQYSKRMAAGAAAGVARLPLKPFSERYEKWQQAGAGRGKIGKFVTAPKRKAGGLLSRFAGVQRKEQLVKETEERMKGMSDRQGALSLATMKPEEQIYWLSRFTKNGTLGLVPNLASYIKNEKTKNMFETYGQGGAYSNLEKAFGSNTEIMNAKDEESAKRASQKFFGGFSQKDLKKPMFDKIFIDPDKEPPPFGMDKNTLILMQNTLSYGIGINQAGNIRHIISGVKGKDLWRTLQMIKHSADSIEKDNPEQAKKVRATIDNIQKKLDIGSPLEFPEAGTTTPAP